MMLAGKRPSLKVFSTSFVLSSFPRLYNPPFVFFIFVIIVSVPTLHPSMFIPPVPHFKTLSATVFSLIGFLATHIGSFAGFNAVPQPSHSEAPFVSFLNPFSNSYEARNSTLSSLPTLPVAFLIEPSA